MHDVDQLSCVSTLKSVWCLQYMLKSVWFLLNTFAHADLLETCMDPCSKFDAYNSTLIFLLELQLGIALFPDCSHLNINSLKYSGMCPSLGMRQW